jgi:hypothetical protein
MVPASLPPVSREGEGDAEGDAEAEDDDGEDKDKDEDEDTGGSVDVGNSVPFVNTEALRHPDWQP